MRFHPEAKRSAYDVVVVGSGLGALTCAAQLAQAGRSVLVVERHDRVGGYAHSFRRGRRLFDSAVHVIGGGVVPATIDALGVAERVDWAEVDPMYAVRFPEFELRAKSGDDAFIAAHLRAFPNAEKGLREFLQVCRNVRDEAERAESMTRPTDVLGARSTSRDPFPTLRRLHRATAAEVLAAHLDDAGCRAAVAALWPYLGLPPSRASFVYFASMLLSYVEGGALYCRGSFGELARAFVHALERDGGEVLLRSPVRRILVDDGRACGVVLENGQRIRAGVVVSGGDLRQTVNELVGREHLPAAYRRRVDRLRVSVSGFVVYAASRFTPPADAAHETFHFRGLDHERAFRGVIEGTPSWWTTTLPSLLDPGLSTDGEQLVVLTTLVSGDAVAPWRDAKEAWVERMLDAADTALPGLRSGLTFAEGATPRTMERYTRNESGAFYGFDVSPDQVGPGRPDHETPLPGLYLAGHWTRPGGGVTGVVTSGTQCARKIQGGGS